MPKLLTFRYHNTNCFFLPSPVTGTLLAIDAGWPCTLHEYSRQLRTLGYGIINIQWAVVTHFHMDHAGLISEFLNSGIECFVFEKQMTEIDRIEKTILKGKEYREYPLIDKSRLSKTTITDFNQFLLDFGLDCEVIPTPAHSQDSMTFVTMGHEAIIGDLAPFDQLMPDDSKGHESWNLIREKCAIKIFPGHAAFFEI